jgi:hypothetical protein
VKSPQLPYSTLPDREPSDGTSQTNLELYHVFSVRVDRGALDRLCPGISRHFLWITRLWSCRPCLDGRLIGWDGSNPGRMYCIPPTLTQGVGGPKCESYSPEWVWVLGPLAAIFLMVSKIHRLHTIRISHCLQLRILSTI